MDSKDGNSRNSPREGVEMCPQAHEIAPLNRGKAVIHRLENLRHYLRIRVGINSGRFTNVSLGFQIVGEKE
jgi:hypothetical protein